MEEFQLRESEEGLWQLLKIISFDIFHIVLFLFEIQVWDGVKCVFSEQIGLSAFFYFAIFVLHILFLRRAYGYFR